MVKAIKVMLIPNNIQKTKMFQYAGASRFAYNWALAREIENYEKGGKFISDAELRKEFTKLRHSDEYAWLLSISNNVTKQAIKDACTAYKNFFKGLQKFPRFKPKKRSIPKFYQDNIKIQFSNTHVKFEGFSSSRKRNKQKLNWVRLAEHGRIPTDAKYMNPRISFDGLNWWISVCVEFPDCIEKLNDDGIGIDLGIKDLAICSDGAKYKNINKSQKVKKLEKQKRRLQRSISRSYEKNKKGESYCKTNNVIKKEKLLLKRNHRLTNIRKNYLNQTISEIVNRKPRFICIEDLNVSGMMKNRHLSKAVQEQGFFWFRKQLECKCNDKSKLDIEKAKEKIEKSLKSNFYWLGREWPYKNVKPRIIAEQYMADNLRDYKLFCFNGTPRMTLVCSERFTEDGLKEDFYDEAWNHLSIQRPAHSNAILPIQRPKQYELMRRLAAKLSEKMSFARIDFYEINEKVYFGEITFYPASGFEGFRPEEWDLKLGEWIELPGGERRLNSDVCSIIIGNSFYNKMTKKALIDYKIFCFNGEIDSVMVCTGREKGHPDFYFYDRNWNRLYYQHENLEKQESIPRPSCFDEMLSLASILCKGFTHIRVDLFEVDGNIYFGELTFFDSSGFDTEISYKTDLMWGSKMKLLI